jgi:hypothetical protein
VNDDGARGAQEERTGDSLFGGLSAPEVAAELKVTVRTLQRDWAKARMLLQRVLAS